MKSLQRLAAFKQFELSISLFQQIGIQSLREYHKNSLYIDVAENAFSLFNYFLMLINGSQNEPVTLH